MKKLLIFVLLFSINFQDICSSPKCEISEKSPKFIECTDVTTIKELTEQLQQNWTNIIVKNQINAEFTVDEIVDDNNNNNNNNSGTLLLLANIEHLDLSKCGILSISIDEGFRNFRSLKKLNVSNTKLTAFKCNWFNEINTIDTIDISHNEIDLDILRDDIKILNKLQSINVGYNLISSIEENSFTDFIHLQKFYLNNNRFDGIVHLGNLPNLRLLDFSGNSISEIPSSVDALTSMDSLQTLDFHQNQIKTIKPNAFEHLQTLRFLDISRNFLDELNAQTFTNLKSIEKLNLSNNLILNIQSNTFTPMQRNLKELDLSHNKLQTINGGVFGENIKFTKFRKFILTKNQLLFIQPDLFLNTPNIDYLHLAFNKLTTIDENTFLTLTKLRKLFLSNNRIEQIQSKLLEFKPDLNEILLHNNHLTFMSNINSHELINLARITITGNPWQCSCLDELLNFLTLRQIQFREKNSPYYLGTKPICIALAEKNCIKNINLVKQQNHLVIENFINKTIKNYNFC